MILDRQCTVAAADPRRPELVGEDWSDYPFCPRAEQMDRSEPVEHWATDIERLAAHGWTLDTFKTIMTTFAFFR